MEHALQNVEFEHGAGLQGTIEGKRYRLGSKSYIEQLGVSLPTAVVRPQLSGQWIYLADSEQLLCRFKLADSLRTDAWWLIERLKAQHLCLHLLSGDSSGLAEQLAEQLQIENCQAAASPQQKLDYITGLQQAGAKVLMIGDGINDVPVLAVADISIAMANASNLAKTQADCILLSAQFTPVIGLLSLAKKTGSTIRQNLAWALSYNLLAMPAAAMGMIPPYLAALGMSLSSLVVIINALRLQTNNSSRPNDVLINDGVLANG